jgi:DNA-binding GntR family transcriptional regulator
MPLSPNTTNTDSRKSIADIAHSFLRGGILNGTFLPGQSLKQDEVAAHLGISRAPVREALNQLEASGLVQLRPRRGYVVASLKRDEIDEIFSLRLVLEEQAARSAARRRTPEDIVLVKRLIREMEEIPADAPDRSVRWAALNREFHAAIYKASRQNWLCQIATNLRDIVELYVRLDASAKQYSGIAEAEHRQIVDAFEAGDSERMCRLSREHVQHTHDRLVSSISRMSPEILDSTS